MTQTQTQTKSQSQTQTETKRESNSNVYTHNVTTITIQPPPGPNLTLPTPSNPRPATNPTTFNDAMQVRQKVFIDEQGVSPESEIDEDDARSWQWVLYDVQDKGEEYTIGTGTGTETRIPIPIAVLRLVPPPHEPHSNLINQNQPAQIPSQPQPPPKYDLHHEPHIKLTRIAVLPEHRKKGHSRTLIETALSWARNHVGEIDDAYRRVACSVSTLTNTDGHEHEHEHEHTGKHTHAWTGLTLVHAQVSVEGMYQRLGFERDDALGRWMEEGIEHVGMWRRVGIDGNGDGASASTPGA